MQNPIEVAGQLGRIYVYIRDNCGNARNVSIDSFENYRETLRVIEGALFRLQAANGVK